TPKSESLISLNVTVATVGNLNLQGIQFQLPILLFETLLFFQCTSFRHSRLCLSKLIIIQCRSIGGFEFDPTQYWLPWARCALSGTLLLKWRQSVTVKPSTRIYAK